MQRQIFKQNQTEFIYKSLLDLCSKTQNDTLLSKKIKCFIKKI